MDLPEIDSRAQWFTNVSTLANLAGYGIEFYSRGQFNEETRGLLLKGLELCELLAKGADASERAEVSLSQLDALKTVQPLLISGRDKGHELHARIDEATQGLKQIINDLHLQRQTMSASKVGELQTLLSELSQAFSTQAFEELSPHEHQPYSWTFGF